MTGQAILYRKLGQEALVLRILALYVLCEILNSSLVKKDAKYYLCYLCTV